MNEYLYWNDTCYTFINNLFTGFYCGSVQYMYFTFIVEPIQLLYLLLFFFWRRHSAVHIRKQIIGIQMKHSPYKFPARLYISYNWD